MPILLWQILILLCLSLITLNLPVHWDIPAVQVELALEQHIGPKNGFRQSYSKSKDTSTLIYITCWRRCIAKSDDFFSQKSQGTLKWMLHGLLFQKRNACNSSFYCVFKVCRRYMMCIIVLDRFLIDHKSFLSVHLYIYIQKVKIKCWFKAVVDFFAGNLQVI